MKMRTRLTAATLLAATAFGLVTAAPAGADETPVPDSKAASKSFTFNGFSGNNQYNTENFTAPGSTPIVGQFAGNAAHDILWYTPGANGDAMWTNDGDFEFTQSPASISGTYAPKVGTFTTPDGYDDILWYHASGVSQLWDYNADGSYTPSVLPDVNGPGQLLVGDFALDGVDDIIRYRPGTASDSWWDFQNAGKMNRPINVNGTYTPLVGEFAGDNYDDILWYAPGSGADSLWDFDGGGAKTEWKLGINGTYTPIVGEFSADSKDDVIWYKPGTGGDSVWNFDGSGYTSKALTVNGTYTPVACYCLQSGSSWEDVVWYNPGSGGDAAWKLTSGDTTYATYATSIQGTSVAAKGAFTLGSTVETLIVRH